MQFIFAFFTYLGRSS